jgi:hypothetical protein
MMKMSKAQEWEMMVKPKKNKTGYNARWMPEMDLDVICYSIKLQNQKPRMYDHMFDYHYTLLTYKEPIGELFLMEQMLLKKGLKKFGKTRAEAVLAELQQLDYHNVIKPIRRKELTQEQ